MPTRTAIVTDSTSSLPASVAARRDVVVVPLQVVIGQEVRTEGVDVDSDDIAAAMRAGTPVNTSRATPEVFSRLYASLADEGADAVVSVHLSAEVSGTFDSAVLAGRDAPVPVHCVDSRQVGMGTAFAALTAADVRDAGGTAVDSAVAAAARGRAASAFFYVDTLEHLRRGGRIGAAAALVGSALAVKPLLGLRDGAIVPLEKVRTAQRALARLEDLAVEAAEACRHGVDLAVQHLADRRRAAEVADRLAERLGLADVAVSEVGAVIGAHVGPGMLAVTVSGRPAP
ncbi:MAG: DegV family protein [Nocardioidaceae bacterium]|nr:DegV family protein [Nocardioidaceae bacterium]